MGNLNRILAVFILLLMTLPMTSLASCADGGSYHYPDASTPIIPTLAREDAQYATINFRNGYEKLILSIGVDSTELTQYNNFVWIFPVPASAEKVSNDVMVGTTLPMLGGHLLKNLLEQTVLKSFFWSSSSQFYPAPLSIMPLMPRDSGMQDRRTHSPDPMFFRGGSDYGYEIPDLPDVQVYDHVDRFGLSTEIVSAKNHASLTDYLSTLGLILPEAAGYILESYVTKEYSFSVSWINDTDEFVSEVPSVNGKYTLGVYLSFPTDRIFFPLKLTSVYGEQSIPILIQVMGEATIAPDQDFVNSRYFSVDYARTDRFSVKPPMLEFFEEQIGSIATIESTLGDPETSFEMNAVYTKVGISSPSYLFVEDLWFVEGAPAEVGVADFVVNEWPIITGLTIALISMLSSLLAGIIVYGRFSPSKREFAILGLANLLTIIGFIAISTRERIDQTYIDQSIIDRNVEEDRPNALPRPMIYFFIIFTVIFLFSDLLWYSFLLSII